MSDFYYILEVDAGVRYWEDTRVNLVKDSDGRIQDFVRPSRLDATEWA
jgi:hypothetical protein